MTELPLPLPLGVAKAGLVVAFLAHLVFVNLMVGGTLVALVAHALGAKAPLWRALAARLVASVTVHKSVAVVLGVGPLLLISVAYTRPFYTSSVLIAPAWLSVLWLVTLAFGLLYAYKHGFADWPWLVARPAIHLATGLAAAACLLVIPLIYLTNTQLMLDAAAMARRPGFFAAMTGVGNVFPRFAHFLLASLAVTGFWVALWWGRAASPFTGEERAAVVRFGARWALGATAAQFLAGPIVLVTLPRGALTGVVIAVLAVGILFGLGSLFALLDTLRGVDRMRRAAVLLALTIVCMGTARHFVREALLERPSDAWVPPARARTIGPEADSGERRGGHGVGGREAADLPPARGGGGPCRA